MILLQDVCKSYGTTAVLDEVSFECHPGTVTAFLGPNGAGKTTLLKILTGLVEPDYGSALIASRRYRDIPTPYAQVGAVLDTNWLPGWKTGLGYLQDLAATLRLPSDDRARQLLAWAGIEPAAKKKIAKYSLGMRQRLGLAGALLGKPQYLILDEPMNGLDPDGIRWFKQVIEDFAEGEGTVLLSSHLLREVDSIADSIVLLTKGRIRSMEAPDSTTMVTATESQQLVDELEAAGLRVEATATGLLVNTDAEEVGARACQAGIALTSLIPQQSMESAYFKATRATNDEDFTTPRRQLTDGSPQ